MSTTVATVSAKHTDTGRLFVVSAPSGAGKTTLCNAIRSRFPMLQYSVSATTRAPRPGERDGVDYHFISKAAFEAGIRSGEWAEWAAVHGNYYGTAARVIDEAIRGGRHILLDIDVQGAAQIVARFPDCVTIFIMPPSSAVLKQRLLDRGTDDPAEIARRLAAAENEMAQRDRYRHVVVNAALDSAVTELSQLFGRYIGTQTVIS
ncbi:MAG: guanylate kinase [Pseudomonadota bacterium]